MPNIILNNRKFGKLISKFIEKLTNKNLNIDEQLYQRESKYIMICDYGVVNFDMCFVSKMKFKTNKW